MSGPPFPTGAMFAPQPAFARGALPTPRHRLAAAMPHRIIGATPAQWLVAPSILSMWLNDAHGDCVTAEEAFNKACDGILISDQTVQTWATAHGVMDGAYLDQVLDWFLTGGFSQDGNTYNDGNKSTVDFTNAAAMTNAVSRGRVKIGVAANQIQATPGVGQRIGWFGTGWHQDQNLDHCVSICGYGTFTWLAWALSQAYGLNIVVPAGMDGSQPGYALYTWKSIGIVDPASLINVTGEAWLRTPNTRTVGTHSPMPDKVWTPGVAPPPPPPSPPPPSPPPSPTVLQSQTFTSPVRKGTRFWDTATVTIPVGSTLVIYAPGPHSIEGVFAAMVTLAQQIAALQTSTDKGFAAVLAAIGVDLAPAGPVGLRSTVARAPGGNVAVTFSWDTAPPDGSVDHYTLQELNPDGTTHGDLVTVPATQTSATVTQPDDPQTYSAALRAVNSAGVGSPPAVASFVPHTEPPPPPPPPVPATPTGFVATVADAAPPPAPQAAPTHAAALLGITPMQWLQLIQAIAADVAALLGSGAVKVGA